jgi:hypothetical protein
MSATRKKNASAGIWEIRDVYTGEKISRFRARRQADVTRYLNMAHIGLGRPIEDFEAVFITEWDGPNADTNASAE